MIILTRLGGPAFAVNPDLIERADSTPDTVLTLVDGTKYVVTEPVETLIERVIEFRARVISRSYAYERESVDELASLDVGRPHLVDREGDRSSTVVPLHRREI